jgi:hypothetical protein
VFQDHRALEKHRREQKQYYSNRDWRLREDEAQQEKRFQAQPSNYAEQRDRHDQDLGDGNYMVDPSAVRDMSEDPWPSASLLVSC